MKKFLFISFFIAIFIGSNALGQESTLPDWFFNPPQTTTKKIYAIGISDPYLKKDKAIVQAKLRAKSMIELYYGAKQAYIRSQTKDNRFIVSSSIKNKNSSIKKGIYKKVKQTFSDYHEAIVLMKLSFHDIKSSVPKSNLIVSYNKSREPNDTIEEVVCSYKTNILSINSGITVYNGSYSNVSSSLNSKKLQLKNNDLVYKKHDNTNSKIYPGFPSYRSSTNELSRGLWPAYFVSTIQSINSLYYINTSSNDKLQFETNNDSTRYISYALDNLSIKNNELKVTIRSTNLTDSRIFQYSKYENVDNNIPNEVKKNQYSFALIIGNQDYQSYQTGLHAEQNVRFAHNDAKIFKKYCERTLSIPSNNIMYALDAGVVKMKQMLNQIKSIIKHTNGKAKIIVYYAGHGMPDEKTQKPYLVPVDVTATQLNLAVSLKELYNHLTEYPSKEVIVFLDACFTGGGRETGLLSSRGVKIKPKENSLQGNLVVFSASSGKQSALPYDKKQHGIFTYYLLQKLKQSKGDITLGELRNYITEKVAIRSAIINNKEQVPEVNVSTEVTDQWKTWKLK